MIRFALASLLLSPSIAHAHDFLPGVLAMQEVEAHVFRFAWTPPVDSGRSLPVELRFPNECRVTGDLADCRPNGIEHAIEFPGLADQRVLMVVTHLDGHREEEIVGSSGSASPSWLALGIEHVLTGYDHLAFVIGLLLVTGFRKRIILTITSFTLAHSLTLALAALELIRLPSAPVEATIAASVMLVARESLHEQPTFTRRFPWLVALLFGLVHGLGFAGALEEIGLPRDSLAGALFLFNAGVEVGQLTVVAACLLIAKLASRFAGRSLLRYVAYAIGSLAAYWLIARTIAIVTAA